MNLNVTHVSPINQERVELDVKQRVAHCYPKFPSSTKIKESGLEATSMVIGIPG